MTNEHKNEDELPAQGEQQRTAIKTQAINNEYKERGGQKNTDNISMEKSKKMDREEKQYGQVVKRKRKTHQQMNYIYIYYVEHAKTKRENTTTSYNIKS